MCAQLTEEARDNAKFLRTAERHFHALASGAVPGIAAALPPLLAALRLVWAISTYYSDDARMSALLQRVATHVAERAEASIPLQVIPTAPAAVETPRAGRLGRSRNDAACMPQKLFHVPHAEASAKLQAAKALMERWLTAYMEVWRHPTVL